MSDTVEVRILEGAVEWTIFAGAKPLNPGGFLVDGPPELIPCTILNVNGRPVPSLSEKEDILNAEIISE